MSLWPSPAWGAPMTLPLGEMGAISAQIPELSTLHGAEAALPPGLPARGSRVGSRAGSCAGSAPGSPRPGAPGRSPAPRGQGGGMAGLAVAHAEAAAEAAAAAAAGAEQLAAGPGATVELEEEEDCWLAELDVATGLPLCLLPQAYGQQELVDGPFAEVGGWWASRTGESMR